MGRDTPRCPGLLQPGLGQLQGSRGSHSPSVDIPAGYFHQGKLSLGTSGDPGKVGTTGGSHCTDNSGVRRTPELLQCPQEYPKPNFCTDFPASVEARNAQAQPRQAAHPWCPHSLNKTCTQYSCANSGSGYSHTPIIQQHNTEFQGKAFFLRLCTGELKSEHEELCSELVLPPNLPQNLSGPIVQVVTPSVTTQGQSERHHNTEPAPDYPLKTTHRNFTGNQQQMRRQSNYPLGLEGEGSGGGGFN